MWAWTQPLDARGKLADRLLEFETRNDVGVYVLSWEEKDYGAGTVLCRPRLCRAPTRLPSALSCSTRITSSG